jgi:hypothetical protein
MAGPSQPKTGGRQKGTPNKVTAQLKDAILLAAENAGGEQGVVGYLTDIAEQHPTVFIPLLIKILPIQIEEERIEKLSGPLDFTFS